MQKKNTTGAKRFFYITTTLPYVNAPLHLGHATEIIRADAIARYKKLMGYEVFFNTGTDEHGMKIYESAVKRGKDVQQHVDEYAVLYKETLQRFGVTGDAHYIRTTDRHHIEAAQEFWRRCDKNGFIYKKNYQVKYCVGCEEEKTDSELVDGKCPEHDRVPELINEENYFFKLSTLGERLLVFYDAHPEFVVPAYRLNELREFIKRGLKDFSVSRLKSKSVWGIPVPGDDAQIIYVWFDALASYISTLGWPAENGDFKRFWIEGTPTQYCGKDNTRFQGLMWQAMLMAAGVPHTHTIVVDGFILGEGGVKMSKSLGNVIDPLEIASEYGTDALRYFVLREFHPFEDTAVSKEKLKEWYNANLANGLGNLVSRIMKMAEQNRVTYNAKHVTIDKRQKETEEKYREAVERYDLKTACDEVWLLIQQADRKIQEMKPFALVKTDAEAGKKIIETLLEDVSCIAELLAPFLPETSEKIQKALSSNTLSAPLFPRKE